MSLTPAGGQGTMTFTGFAGYGCAATEAAAASSTMVNALRNSMGPPCSPFESEQSGAEHGACGIEPGVDRRCLERHQQQQARDDERDAHAERHDAKRVSR